MSTVSHYFCIFCEFTCEEYDNAFDHYCSHMFVNGNCELCDYEKLVELANDPRDDFGVKIFVEYKSDPSDLSIKCESCQIRNKDIYGKNTRPVLSEDQKIIINVTHYWIRKFLSYQNKIFDKTYEKLLVENKVCRECAVCRYLVDKYASNGGDMSRIEYIRDNKVEHCYQHMRYDPNSSLINACIDRYESPMRLKRILKLEVFIEHCCDTFFTGDEDISDDKNDNKVSLVNIGDDNPKIQDNECVSRSEATQSITQVSPSFEDTLQQSLAPIFAKLNAVESEIVDTNSRIDRIDSEQENTESKLENYESELNTIKRECNEAIPPATVAYFASPNAPIGWLKADGQTVSRVKYAKLFVTIGTTFGCGDGINTFTLPDLRGEFIRGWSNDRGDVDRNRAFGSFQFGSSIPMGGNTLYSGVLVGVMDALDLSFAGVSFDNSFDGNVRSGQTCDGITYPRTYYKKHTIDVSFSNHLIQAWNVLKGTRPRNIALLACIKY